MAAKAQKMNTRSVSNKLRSYNPIQKLEKHSQLRKKIQALKEKECDTFTSLPDV